VGSVIDDAGAVNPSWKGSEIFVLPSQVPSDGISYAISIRFNRPNHVLQELEVALINSVFETWIQTIPRQPCNEPNY
jgi:hypothetical protein